MTSAGLGEHMAESGTPTGRDSAGTRTRVTLIPCHDEAGWRDALARVGGSNVFCEPGYARVTADGDPVYLVVARGEGAEVVFPIVVRPLPSRLDLPGWFDAESPYGYPGVLQAGRLAAVPVLLQAIAAELEARRIVNVFLRLNPFQPMVLPRSLLFGPPHAVAIIPITEGRDRAFQGGSCSWHRYSVRKAASLGLVVEVRPAPDDAALDRFREMYVATMDRAGAGPSYYFSREYFCSLAGSLGSRVILITVSNPDGVAEAAGVFVACREYLYYHLGARSDGAHACATHAVLEKAADVAADLGLSGVHLGGGMTDDPDDTLWLFKRHVGRQRASVRFAGLVACGPMHRRLNAMAAGCIPARFQAYRMMAAPAAGEAT